MMINLSLTACLLALPSIVPPQVDVGPEAATQSAALALPVTALPVTAGRGAAQHLVKVTSDPRGLLRLQRLDLDLLSLSLAEGEATLLVTEAEMELIRGVRLTPEVLVDDLEDYYARRLAAGAAEDNAGVGYGQWLNPPFGQGSMGGNYTYAEIGSVLDQLTAAYPQFVSPKSSIGASLEGRELWMVRVSDNPGVDEPEPEMRIDALHHAREPQGMQTTLYFLCYLLEEYGSDPVATYLLDEREIYVVPCVNPDGYEFNRQQSPGGGGLWRKNRRNNGGSRGVDLNRNYPFQWGGTGSSGSGASEAYRGPAPASEPEVQAMIQFIDSREFETSLSVHSFSDVWLAPWGYVGQYPPAWNEIGEVGDLAVQDNGYPHGPASIVLYQADGISTDYEYGVKGTYSWIPEIGSSFDGFWPPRNRIVPLAEENLTAFASTVLAAGPWVRPQTLTITDAGDGDGTLEPGEPIEIELVVRNSGRGDAPAATLALATSSPFATVTTAQSSLSVPSFTTRPGAVPLQLLLDPLTPPGEVVNFTVTLTEGGRVEEREGSFVVSLRTIAAYDFEAADDEGWTVGAPNNAFAGEWTRVDPVGSQIAPEDDNTPGAGRLCWVTGESGNVDFGSTTLLSPVFDLEGSAAARLRYARWYHNSYITAPQDDVFAVDVSDDGGATWTNAQLVGPFGPGTDGGWVETTIDIGAFVALTDQVRVRFVASDLGSPSFVEAAVDDVILLSADGGCPQPENYCALSPNQYTAGAVMGFTGSTDVTLNQLALTVADANPSGFGLFFFGQGRDQVSVGTGSLCIAGAFVRLPAVQTDATGAASYPLDFPSLPVPLANGETWNFQFWYRDSVLGIPITNFSDGLEIRFCQ